MNLERVNSILDNKEKTDVFYNERLVWIQSVNHDTATIGFVDNFEEKKISIFDLYE